MKYDDLQHDKSVIEKNVVNKLISKLEESEARFKKLVNQSRDGIVIVDTNGKVYDANQNFADMLGYTVEEARQLYVWDWDKNFTKEELLALAAAIDEKGHYIETSHTRKDGTIIDIELNNSRTYFDGKKLIFCICRNVTERNQNEARLRRSQETLSTFLDHFQGIAYQISISEIDSFRSHLFKGAIKLISGYEEEELSSLIKWDGLIHPHDISHLNTIRKRFSEFPGYCSNTTYRIIRKDGEIRWIRDTAQIVKIGEDNLLHGTLFDITLQKLAEEEKKALEEQIKHTQKLEAIGNLAGGVAHDFNNILNIIMGYTNILLKKTLDPSGFTDRLNQIKKACNRAKDIIQQLLTFSQKCDLKKELIDVKPVIEEAIVFLRSTLPSNINIKQQFETDSTIVLADPTQIHQVIMNLCLNAAQAIENQEGIIDIKIIGKTKDNTKEKMIQISVSDNGPGIDPDIADRIFEPYFSTRQKGQGSGMGLAVVHGIIENHGGSITMRSEPGIKTTFAFELPVVNWQIKRIQKLDRPKTRQSGLILFVDDERDITDIGKIILEDEGFQVQTTNNPLDALDLFREKPDQYDLVVTDMTMPDLTGDALFKEIRKIRTDIPVILCTGYSQYIDEDAALKMGISAYVRKPVDGDNLIDIVRKVLTKQHQVE